MKEQINIGVISDNNYAQHLGVEIFSILKNCSFPENLHFYISDGGINEENKEKLRALCSSFRCKVTFLIMSKSDWNLFKGMKMGSHLPPFVYSKILFPTKLKNLKKMLILDSDIIVEGDISELYRTNLDGKTIGAVPDGYIELQEICKKNLGISKEKEYFNTGVMLIDCIKWRKYNVLGNLIDFIKKNPDKIYVQEQDGLNATLQDEWKQLPYEWNVIHLFYYHSRDLKRKLGKEKLNEIIKHPKIIHFTTKPWVYDKVHPLANRYWYYLKQTPWKDSTYPNKNTKTFFLRMFKLIIRPIPWEIKIKIKNFFKKIFGKPDKTGFYYVGKN